MVQVRYYLAVYIKNNIPTRVDYKTRAGVVVCENVIDDTKIAGYGEDTTEFYIEYDSLGLFLNVNTIKNKISKKDTWVQDFKDVDGNIMKTPSHYKPKTTIKYINE